MDHRELVQTGLDHIENNLRTDISAQELADSAGFSLFHYYRLFQHFVGVPLGQYIIRRRLLNAIFEIGSGKKMIDAAFDYGFDSYAGFYKAFRREFGCSPSAYLKYHQVKKPYRIDLFQEEQIMTTRKRISRMLAAWNMEHADIADVYYQGTSRKNEHTFWVTGTPLLSSALYQDTGGELSRFLGRSLAKLHIALQSLEKMALRDNDLLTLVKETALPQSRDILGLEANFCSDYLRVFEELYPSLPRQLIHRDPHPGNILVQDGAAGFLDFDLSERNLRLYDICYAATAVLSEPFPESSWDAEGWLHVYRGIISGYDEIQPLTAAERKAIPYVLLANQFVCVSWFSRQAQYEDVFKTNVAMTRWLLGHFDELRV